MPFGRMVYSKCMSSITSFKDLDCWKRAKSIQGQVFNLVKNWDWDRRFLKVQLLKAITSVTANIAEGFGRYYYLENAKFCRIARASLFEIIDHLESSVVFGWVKQDLKTSIEIDIMKTIQCINGYINYLTKKKSD